MPPRVCILASQYFAWGKYGGFGSMSRKLATSLAAAGVSVEVIVPRRGAQRPVETVDGVRVSSFDPLRLDEAWRLLRASNAEVFHSQDPTVVTWLAQRAQPHRAHLITCRDPRERSDWWVELRHASWRRRLLTPMNYLTESGLLVRRAVRRADGVYCPAHFLVEKVTRLYRPHAPVAYLPNLVDVPAAPPEKREPPTIAFVARWDRRKRPEIFLDLPRRFPGCRFVAVGVGEDREYDERLRRRHAGVANLEMPGFIDRFGDAGLDALLARSWILVNTAAREGLPLSFLEAAAQGCAILSAVDPDGFASRFGVRVRDDGFAMALARLLAGDPIAKGREAHRHVRESCETSHALRAHLEEYERHAP